MTEQEMLDFKDEQNIPEHFKKWFYVTDKAPLSYSCK